MRVHILIILCIEMFALFPNRAADWKLDQPDWTGRVRVCAKGKECYIKIEDKNSGKVFNTTLRSFLTLTHSYNLKNKI